MVSKNRELIHHITSLRNQCLYSHSPAMGVHQLLNFSPTTNSREEPRFQDSFYTFQTNCTNSRISVLCGRATVWHTHTHTHPCRCSPAGGYPFLKISPTWDSPVPLKPHWLALAWWLSLALAAWAASTKLDLVTEWGPSPSSEGFGAFPWEDCCCCC